MPQEPTRSSDGHEDADAEPTVQWSKSSENEPDGGAESPSSQTPDTLYGGRYRTERELGAGGYGAVFAGFDTELRRPVAIKVARPDRAARAMETFLREARHLAKLNHESILRVYDVGLQNDERFIVTDLIDGLNLHKWLKRNSPSCDQIALIAARIADGLAHAHAERIIHRDVKPGNILMSKAGVPVLADFGLALAEEEMAFGPDRSVKGTFAYMSPEQARGEGHRIDGRTDIYSLGVVLYEMLCGKRPFQASSRNELLRQVREDEPQPPRQLNREISPELERICLRAMAKRIKDRFVTASDFAAELRNSIDQTAVSGTIPSLSATTRPVEDRDPHARDSTSAIRIVPKGARSFDRGDHDFFLELLPGPRDTEGLPESLRFWKSRIEPNESLESFAVGVLYGPSGCGKSSLVRAGLLPRIDPAIRTIWLEASATDTESKLRRAVKKCFHQLPERAPLNELLAAARSEHVNGGRKTLIVVDQFEQWLQENSGDLAQTELASALRQADGDAVQVLLMVRDDFWLGVTRLFDFLERKLDPDFNIRCVDLFDARHARRVLSAFGHAYGQLPESRSELTDEQNRFLDQAIEELSEDGLVIPVRLSLFSELMKGRPWTVRVLNDVGGTQGVGVRFLEESFASRSAVPENRLLEQHARALLADLLPRSGAKIRGKMRSRADLALACQLDPKSPKLDRLLEILDRQLHIVTPAEPVETMFDTAPDSESTSEAVTPMQPHYQLAHDYLVGSLRQWLMFERQKTWRGRAEMRLDELTEQMRQWPKSQYLPRLREYVQISVAVPARKRTADHRELMRQATRRHLTRVSAAAFVVVVVALLLGYAWRQYDENQRSTAVKQLVTSLLVETHHGVPPILAELRAQAERARAPLEAALARTSLSKPRLRIGLALQRDDLVLAGIQTAAVDELQLAVDELTPQSDNFAERLAQIVSDSKELQSRRLRVAAVLAARDPANDSLKVFGETIAAEMVSQDVLKARQWIALLRPAKRELAPHLQSPFRDSSRPNAGLFAAAALADFSAGDLEKLMPLLREAQPGQLSVIAEQISKSELGVTELVKATNAASSPELPLEERLKIAKSRAHAAIALLILAEQEDVAFSLLRAHPRPDARSYFIQLAPKAALDPQKFAGQLNQQDDPAVRASLVQVLGGYHPSSLSLASRETLLEELEDLFKTDPNPGLHYSIDWLLGRWNDRGGIEKSVADLTSFEPINENRWIHSPMGHALVVVKRPGVFQIDDARQPTGKASVEIGYDYAIGAMEITYQNLLTFGDAGRGLSETQTVDCPAGFVSVHSAAAYCNWLSKKEGLGPDDLCYEITEQGNSKLHPDFLERRGYRLPLNHESEFAARALTSAKRYHGDNVDVLPAYAATYLNYRGGPIPVGSFLPNDFGLFDTLGNISEWCHSIDGAKLHMRGGNFRSQADKAIINRAPTSSGRNAGDTAGFRILRVLKPNS